MQERTLSRLTILIVCIILLSLLYQYFSDVSYTSIFTGNVVTIDPSCSSNATVTLGIGETLIRDGDPYPGESIINPNWTWILSDLNNYSSPTTFVQGQGSRGPFIGVGNNFTKTTLAQGPITTGECYDFPNFYLSFCFEALAGNFYTDFRIQRVLGYNTLSSGWAGGLPSTDVISFNITEPGNFTLRTTDWLYVESSNNPSGKNTTLIVLQASGVPSDNVSFVFYNDPSQTPSLRYAGNISLNKSTLASVTYLITAGNNIVLQTDMLENSKNQVNVVVNISGDSASDLGIGEEVLFINFTKNDTAFNSLGTQPPPAFSDPGELRWSSFYFTPRDLGGVPSPKRTLYGVIIQNPRDNGQFFDRVYLQVPFAQVEANIAVNGLNNSKIVRTVPLGKVVPNETYGYEWNVGKNLLNSLLNTSILFDNRVIMVHDALIFGSITSPNIETSLTSFENYQAQVYIETERKALLYGFFFDDLVNLSNITKGNPLYIKVLGVDDFVISELTSPTSFKKYDSFVLLNASSADVNVSGVEINLLNITTNSVVLSVNGTQQEITNGNWASVGGTTIFVKDIATCSFSVTSPPPQSPEIPISSSSSSSKYKKHFNFLQGGKNTILRPSKQNLAVTKLETIVKKDVSDVDLEVNKLNQLPSSLPIPASRADTYQYFEVNFGDLSASDFIKSEIEFKVKESWVDNQGFNNEHKVKLFKYKNGWVPLDTTLSLRDSTYLYYTAVTNGFSYFAIILSDEEPDQALTQETPPSPCGNGIIDQGETCANCPADFICISGYFCQDGVCTRVAQPQPPLPPPPSRPVTQTPQQRSFFEMITDYSLYIGFGVAALILVIVFIVIFYVRKKPNLFSRSKD